jgi:3-phenylpropionate/cinnamic acid dioxygenase small subunit
MTIDVQDRIAISDLYSRCARDMDNLASDAWIDCFTADAVFESPRFGRFSGRDNLLQLNALRRRALMETKIRHVISNVLISMDGPRATGECYLCAYETKFHKTKLVAVGGYRDTLIKVEGRWFFRTREEFFDTLQPATPGCVR